MESCSAHDSPQNPNPNPNPNHTYTYDSPHPIYAMAFSTSSPSPLLALGSFLEESQNQINLISFNNSSLSFLPSPILSLNHHFPPTKLQFHPSPSSPLLASSSDLLRIFSLQDSSSSILSNSNSPSPLTSFDWNISDPRRIVTSSIDTTCTVWDLHRSSLDTQLIAHDKEVYDVAWGGPSVFASVSADSSLRVFDLRDKEHSAIVYENNTPLLRLAWNRADLRYMATIVMDGSEVIVLDIRSPAVPVAELRRHFGGVNAVAWGPGMGRHVCSAGDDGQALIWEVPGTVPEEGVDPVLAYQAGAEINQLQWCDAQPDWIGIAFGNKVQLLRV